MLANKTEHNKIYCQVYWSGHEYDDSMKEIINNRNNFIKDYDIKKIDKTKKTMKYCDMLNNKDPYFCDHIESYKTNNNMTIILMSPYNNKDEQIYINDGWIKIYNMYSYGTTTYLKYVI